mmetsp:Transcript_20787/g.39049  ORF Transcript_20787/g.39049 Transcript_20787/m.39049 type:complete len:228 (-) Transcript_20787:33-716(-)
MVPKDTSRDTENSTSPGTSSCKTQEFLLKFGAWSYTSPGLWQMHASLPNSPCAGFRMQGKLAFSGLSKCLGSISSRPSRAAYFGSSALSPKLWMMCGGELITFQPADCKARWRCAILRATVSLQGSSHGAAPGAGVGIGPVPSQSQVLQAEIFKARACESQPFAGTHWKSSGESWTVLKPQITRLPHGVDSWSSSGHTERQDDVDEDRVSTPSMSVQSCRSFGWHLC